MARIEPKSKKMGDAKQIVSLVSRQFEEQISLYTENANVYNSPIISFLYDWIQGKKDALQNRFPLHVCEFGGAGGNMLLEIQNKIGRKFIFHNAELVEKYRSTQVLETINFTRTSILDSEFENDCFDIVILRDLLHHLIGKSIRHTRANQLHAINEAFRVVRRGGLVLIEEQVNRYHTACIILYHLSKLASTMGIRNKRFMITPYTIVGYLTQKEIVTMCRKCVPSINWLANEYERWDMPLHWRLTILMNNTGHAFMAMQKP